MLFLVYGQRKTYYCEQIMDSTMVRVSRRGKEPAGPNPVHFNTELEGLLA